MRIILYTFCLLLFVLEKSNSQRLTIIDALHLHEELDYKGRKPIKIVEKRINYSIIKTEIRDSIIKTFDNNGMIRSYEFYSYNDDSIIVRDAYVNDTINNIKLLKTSEVRQNNTIGKKASKYLYDNQSFLTSIIDYDGDSNVIRKTAIACNEKGHPIELSLFNKEDKLIAKERAIYFYDSNKVVRYIDLTEQIVINSKDSSKISLKNEHLFPSENIVFNNYGDKIKWYSNWKFDKNSYYEREYIYDSFGNWIESKIYVVQIQKNRDPYKEIKSIISRAITYE